MNFISNEYWKELLPIVILLFKRNKSAQIWPQNWATWSVHLKTNIVVMHCHICDKSINTELAYIDYFYDSQFARQHALFHLKEHNLVPFI